MPNETGKRSGSRDLLAFLAFGGVLGVVMYLVEFTWDISIATWLKAVVFGVVFIAFILAYVQFRKGSESQSSRGNQ